MDDNRSQTLDMDEFKKAARDYRFELNDREVELAFKAFDRKNEGNIDYDEFLRTIRGSMNNFRRNLCGQAFKKMDKNGSGQLDINDIKGVYNAKFHPEVKAGKKTEDEVFLEFLETFESSYDMMAGETKDGIITIDEWMEYYENVSMSIDDDAYFELMMNNCWRMNEHTTYNNNKRGWSNKEEEPTYSAKVQDSYQKRVVAAGNSSRPVSAVAPSQVENPNYAKGRAGDFSDKKEIGQQRQVYQNAPFGVSEGRTNYSTSNRAENYSGKNNFSNKGDDVIIKFREKISARGTRGIFGLRRSFMIADDNNSKTIDVEEFAKLIRDYRYDLSEADRRKLFNIMDVDRTGEINYEEFLRGIVGEMNDFRKGLTKKAFMKMDKNKNGKIELDDVRGVYNAKFHPDVKAGKKTEDEVLAEFLDNFEYHFSLLVKFFYCCYNR